MLLISFSSLSQGSSAPAAPAAKTPPSKPAGQPAPTSPVSTPAGGPPPTTDPTAPVSDKGKQDAAKKQAPKQGGGASGKIDIKGDDLEWENPDSHEIHSISPDQVVKYAKTKPKFLAALKGNPDVYNKYKDMINQKIAQKKAGKGTEKKPEGGEGEKPQVAERIKYINPFNRDNFLL